MDLKFESAWEAPPTPPLSPSDVEKPLPTAAATAGACGRSPAAAMRELAALAASETTPPQATEAARLGQSLLMSAARLLALEDAHTALSADFDAKMYAWDSAIYVSAHTEVKAARTAALETLQPLRESVAATNAARAAWAALDALRSCPAAQAKECATEFEQREATEAGKATAAAAPGPAAAQAPPSMVESLINYFGNLTSTTAAQHVPAPAPQQLEPFHFPSTTAPAPFSAAPFQHMHLPPGPLLGGPQPAPVLVRSRPAASPPIFGGVPLTEPRSSPPRRGPSPTLHGLGGDELGMMPPIAEGVPMLTTEGLDLSTVLAVAATGVPPFWNADLAHSGLEAGDDPMFGLSHMLKQQLDAMLAAQQHSGGGESGGGADAGGGGRGSVGEEMEYADVLCAMGRDRQEEWRGGRGGAAWLRDSGSREGGATPATGSDAFTPGTSPEEDLSDPEMLNRRARLKAAVAPFFSSASTAAAPALLTGIHGVTLHKRSGKYEAHIWAGKKQSYLGSYRSQAAAARAHDIAAVGARVSETRMNYPAADYAALRPLLEPLDNASVVKILKEVSRRQPGSGRGSAESGQKRGRPRGSPGTQAEMLWPVKRKGPSERSPLA